MTSLKLHTGDLVTQHDAAGLLTHDTHKNHWKSYETQQQGAAHAESSVNFVTAIPAVVILTANLLSVLNYTPFTI